MINYVQIPKHSVYSCERQKCSRSSQCRNYYKLDLLNICHFYLKKNCLNVQFSSASELTNPFSSKAPPVGALLFFFFLLHRLMLGGSRTGWGLWGATLVAKRGKPRSWSEFGSGPGWESKLARVKACGPPPIINTSSITIWNTQYKKVLYIRQV